MAPQSGKYPHYIHYFHGLPVKYYINCQNKGYDKTGAYKKTRYRVEKHCIHKARY
ncbi:hypothetical protein M113_3674 [Bacteroides fragilis str. 3986 N3]|uniref:Uncharacterized protein n=3 Tax=Bacteroides fragilis TaxID=817 RepID=A0A015VXT2_BACFG|nr:hypothetical protein M121_3383 [Bacteroides fragilis str. 3783N2-1]EXY54602.1 hypothetical protein M122_3361 [Bacteroides fragilis str. 3976T7]EXY73010.1 hypothetical protein M124_3229 [Bacteroides fragilis str. 3988T(B)14]EXY78884.1 hypothetical protein M084_3322 [Bacteroides fragilis str. 3988 T1]EXZ23008.1 hypothetical protein M086_3222 [Bacteroides fragilis str. S13 L11]EXZ66504.1 hypothetical protein M120_3979 [Bacteroides fragilis str. 3783N1-8]EYA13161.1 hypothetical protein M104_38